MSDAALEFGDLGFEVEHALRNEIGRKHGGVGDEGLEADGSCLRFDDGKGVVGGAKLSRFETGDDGGGGAFVMRKDFFPQLTARGGEANLVGATIAGNGEALNPAGGFHAIDQAGDVRAVDDEDVTEFALGEMGRRILENVEHVELCFGEAKRFENAATGTEQGVAGAHGLDDKIDRRRNGHGLLMK